MSKKNNERKEKIKDLLLKTLHVICYILSIAFIGICVFSGVQSCQKTSKVSAENLPLQAITYNDYEYIYSYKYLNTEYLHIDLSDQKSLIDGYLDLDLDYQYSESQLNVYCDIPFNGVLLNSDNSLYDSLGIRMCYSTRLFTDGYSYYYYSYRLEWFIFQNVDSQFNWLISYHPTSDDLYTTSDPFVYFVFKDEPSYIQPFLYFFELSNKSNFIFNRNFNYNAPMGVTVQTPYYTRPGNIQGSGVSYYFRYDVGLFISNNEIFDYIRWEWTPSLGAVYYDFGDGNIKKGPDGSEQGSFIYLMYGNSLTNTLKIVNSRDQIAFMPSNSSYGYYYANSSTWINDNYRSITFLQNLSTDLKTKIESFNNNNQNYSNGSISGSSDIFSLLSLAFTSLIPFLSANILPSISIGVLLFLPSIVGIIVIIFNILRK